MRLVLFRRMPPGEGIGGPHGCVPVRCSPSGPHANPPLDGGTTMVRVHSSVRVCSPLTQVLHGLQPANDQADSTQLTGCPPPLLAAVVNVQVGPDHAALGLLATTRK